MQPFSPYTFPGTGQQGVQYYPTSYFYSIPNLTTHTNYPWSMNSPPQTYAGSPMAPSFPGQTSILKRSGDALENGTQKRAKLGELADRIQDSEQWQNKFPQKPHEQNQHDVMFKESFELLAPETQLLTHRSGCSPLSEGQLELLKVNNNKFVCISVGEKKFYGLFKLVQNGEHIECTLSGKEIKLPFNAVVTIPSLKELFSSKLEKKNVDTLQFRLPYPQQLACLSKVIKFPQNAEWSLFHSDKTTKSSWWNAKLTQDKIIFYLNEYNFPVWVISTDGIEKKNCQSLRRNFTKIVLRYYLEIDENTPKYGGVRFKIDNEPYFLVAPKPESTSEYACTSTVKEPTHKPKKARQQKLGATSKSTKLMRQVAPLDSQQEVLATTLQQHARIQYVQPVPFMHQQQILPQQNMGYVAPMSSSSQLPLQVQSVVLERERILSQQLVDIQQKNQTMKFTDNMEHSLKLMGQLQGELMIIYWVLASSSPKEQIDEQINAMLLEQLQRASAILNENNTLEISDIKNALFSEIGERDENLSRQQAVSLLVEFNLGLGLGIAQGISLVSQYK